MAGKILNLGVNLLVERFLGTSSEATISRFKIGIGTTAPSISDTALEIAIPISDGTVNDDGSNLLTGSSGGDNSTDNTTTFKEGAGQVDVTAQNLIANNGNASKIWTIANLAAAGVVMSATEPYGLWLYIKDATALAKFLTAGTTLSIKFRTNGDGATLFYEDTFTASQLAVGWNWITSNTTAVNGLAVGGGGAPSGVLNEFVITITTNNATDTFVAGDVVYDLLRQWATTDLVKNIETTYPSYNSSTKEITSRCVLTLSQANGFPLTEILIENVDGSGWSRDTFTLFSKSSSEELRFKNRDLFDNS